MSRKRRVLKILGGLLAAAVLLVGGLLWFTNNSLGRALNHCESIVNLDSRYDPPGLLRGAAYCVREDRMEDAADLFALAGVYGRFDMGRVRDKSAHQVISTMIMANFVAIDRDQRESFERAISAVTNDRKQLAGLCGKIRRIGRPTYLPIYMLAHGMSNFIEEEGKKPPLVEGFDAKKTWAESLDTYLHCPGRRQEATR